MVHPLPAPKKRPPRWQSWLRNSVLIVAGVVMGFGWLHPAWLPCAWVGIITLNWFAGRQSHQESLKRGIVLGTAGIVTAFFWVPQVFAQCFNVSYITGVILFLPFAYFDGLHFGLAAYLAAWLRPTKVWQSLLFPLCFVALEFFWLRVFPWRLGHSQIQWLSFIQIAEFTGVYGVSFLMAWMCSLIALLGQQFYGAYRQQPVASPLGRWEIATCVLLFLANLGFGYWRINDLEAKLQQQPELKIALIQTQARADDAEGKLQAFSASVADQVDLVCWPESSTGIYSHALTDFRSAEKLVELSYLEVEQKPVHPWKNPGSALLCAGMSFPADGTADGPFFVTAFLIDQNEQILGRYHKRNPIPFGEYVPGEAWFPALHGLCAFPKTITPGGAPEILHLPGQANIGVLICYEDMIEPNARTSVLAGADLLVDLANGADFGDSPAMEQHQQLAHFRAIENRRYFVRCATTGSSAVITPTGKVQLQLPLRSEQTAVATVHPFSGRTFYTLFGGVFGYACWLALGLLFSLRWNKGKIPN